MSYVLLDRPRPHVALITLNRPERMNSMAFHVMVPFREMLDAISVDNDVRVVVITGAGRGFCSGADQTNDGGVVPNIDGLTPPTIALRALELLDDIVLTLRKMHQPVIGAINGAAIGGGLCLSLACDIRIASDAAYFRAAGINNGLTASELGLSYLLPRAIGSSRASEIMLTGRDVDAAEAERDRAGVAHGAARRAPARVLRRRGAHHRLEPARRGAHQAHALVEPRRSQPGAAHEPGGDRPALREDAHRQLRGSDACAQGEAHARLQGHAMSPVAPAPIELPQLSTGLTTFAADDPGTWQPLLDRAVAADRAGIDRVVVSDHVVFGEDLEAYGRPELGGSAGGKQPTGPDGHWLEPLTTLSVIAGMTSRVRLGTNIVIAALRRPVVLAKTAATLDVLSGGRLDLGVGVGWQREEYDAAGLDFETRGDLLDHTLAVCQTLWREQRARRTPTTGSASSTSTRCRSRPGPAACRSGSAAP